MKRIISVFLSMLLLLTMAPSIYADQLEQNVISELYSIDGYYKDDVGNGVEYSYHVPQINADTSAAKEINTEIAENFGERVENQLEYMEGGYSLWSPNTEWDSYRNGSQIFLLITSDENGDITEYGAYGYDFETGERVTNSVILEQKGISEEQYMEKLAEATTDLFEDLYVPIPEGVKTNITHDSLLEETLGWLSADTPIFINRFGEIETWAEIATVAGAGRYKHLVTVSLD